MDAVYKYIGNGDALVHVPPRDLTQADIDERAADWAEMGITEQLLVMSGLYTPVVIKIKSGAKPAKDE